MAESVKIVIPPAVSPFVKPDTPVEQRLRGAGGIPSLLPREELMLLFCLSKDKDPQVKDLALSSLAGLSTERISCIEGWDDLHPAVLHAVALSHGADLRVRELILHHPLVAETTKKHLLSIPPDDSPQTPLADQPVPATFDEADEDGLHDDSSEGPSLADSEDPDDPDDLDEEKEGEEFLSKYQIAQVMGIGEKIKMALTGDKEWRKILIKDSNKLVSSGVLKNPRITEPEVLNVLKSGTVNDEIMRLICANKEWVKNYPIRKALVENPKTPLANALRFLGTLNDKDISGYAKSRNISSVLSTQAKRMILSKQNKR